MSVIEVSAILTGFAAIVVALKTLGMVSFLTYLKQAGWKDIYDDLHQLNRRVGNLEDA